MTDETKRKLPRGIHQLPDGRFRIYVTRQGKPVRLMVTWELLKELKVPVPPTRLQHQSSSDADGRSGRPRFPRSVPHQSMGSGRPVGSI